MWDGKMQRGALTLHRVANNTQCNMRHTYTYTARAYNFEEATRHTVANGHSLYPHQMVAYYIIYIIHFKDASEFGKIHVGITHTLDGYIILCCIYVCV